MPTTLRIGGRFIILMYRHKYTGFSPQISLSHTYPTNFPKFAYPTLNPTVWDRRLPTPGTQRCKECTQNSGTGNVAAQPLYDFYEKIGKFPSPTPDPSLPGHFLNFLQLFRSDKGESALPDEFLPSLNAKVGAAELDSARCATCSKRFLQLRVFIHGRQKPAFQNCSPNSAKK